VVRLPCHARGGGQPCSRVLNRARCQRLALYMCGGHCDVGVVEGSHATGRCLRPRWVTARSAVRGHIGDMSSQAVMKYRVGRRRVT